MQPQSDESAQREDSARAIGEVLGDRRRSLGLSLEDVAAKLHPYPALSPGDERQMQEAMAQVTGA